MASEARAWLEGSDLDKLMEKGEQYFQSGEITVLCTGLEIRVRSASQEEKDRYKPTGAFEIELEINELRYINYYSKGKICKLLLLGLVVQLCLHYVNITLLFK